MDIKNFLQSSYKKENFVQFIFDKFYGFEENNTDYELPFTETEQKHIQKYKFLGQVVLDDDKEIGFFEVITTEKTDIENNRVSLNNILKNKASNELLDGAIAIFHNPLKADVYRLSFIKFSYDDNNKEEVTNLKRFTYVLGKNIPIKTAYNQLKNLKYPTITELEEAFSVEKISQEFFTKYKKLYHQLVEDIVVVNKEIMTDEEKVNQEKSYEYIKNEKTISFYIKKLLGRIVFLYFVQKKGWLNNDKKFLSNLFYSYTKENPNINFYDEILETLFFNALNTKRDEDKITLGGKEYTIPYLNGGLFEEDEYDKVDIAITNNDLRQVLELFDSYNFTIIEDTPHDSEIAIDPEMLGKVFEDLLEDRKEKGAFYTPREIVHYMCQQSIINYLANFYDKDSLEDIKSLIVEEKTDTKFIKDNAQDIKTHLDNIKILDPAIGSGAFPMGMLHEIVTIFSNLNKMLSNDEIAKIKRKVIENSIYGIDIENSAVEIAKLRFWLSIVVDEEKPTPLPNLKYKIMVGNSLIETINGFDPLIQNQNQKAKNELKFLKEKFHRYFNASNNQEKEQINQEIKQNVLTVLSSAMKNFDIQPKLEMDKKEQKEYEENIEKYNLLKSILDDYRLSNHTTKLFLYKVYFKEVLDDGGFDIVIGNPPYLRVQGIDNEISEQYKEIFKSATGRYDLYVLFVEKGLSLLSKDGVLNYIMPHKWVNSAFGKGIREISKDKLSKLISFGAYQVFNASTYTSLVWFQNSNKNKYLNYIELDKNLQTNNQLEKYLFGLKYKDYTHILNSDLSSDSWSFSDKNTYEVLKKLEKQDYRLSDIFKEVFQGTVTTGDSIFYLKGKFIEDKFIGFSDALNKEITIEKDIVKPLLVGDDVKKYAPLTNKLYTIYPHYLEDEKTKPFEEDIFKSNFPLAYDYLLNFKDELVTKKKKYKTNEKYWYSLHRARDIKLFEQEKILTAEISYGCNMTIDTDGYYTNTQNYSFIKNKHIKESYKFYLSILNSKLLWFYIKKTGAVLANGYFRFKTNYLKPFPIPKIENIENTKSFEILVDYTMYLIKNKKDNYIIKFFERVIDIAVYELYFKDELHSKGFGILEVLEKELVAFDNNFETIENIYKKFNDKNHKISYNINFIDTLDIVKTIENKE